MRQLLRAFDGEVGGVAIGANGGLGAAYGDAVGAGCYCANAFFVDLGKSAGTECEGDVLCITRSEVEACKAAEGKCRGDVSMRRNKVEFGNLVPSATAGIFNVSLHNECVSCVELHS